MTSGQAPGRAEPYIPNGGRAKAVVAAFWANIAVQVVLAALTAFQIHLLTDIVAGRPVPQAVLEASDARMQVAAGLDLGVFVVTGVLFLTQLRRAYYNLVPLGAPRRKFDVGWSVGWFSIPFYSLVRPYQVLAEIRAAADEPGNTAHAQAGRTLAGWWWGTFLAMGFVNRALGAAWRTAKTAEEMISAPFVGFASYAATIVAALVAMLLVRTITGGQERMAARIGQPQQPTDAASPVD